MKLYELLDFVFKYSKDRDFRVDLTTIRGGVFQSISNPEDVLSYVNFLNEEVMASYLSYDDKKALVIVMDDRH